MRFMNDDQCKKLAEKISAEMKTYQADMAAFKAAEGKKDEYRKYPMWGPDFDSVVEKIKRLFHPDEAEIIIKNLTV